MNVAGWAWVLVALISLAGFAWAVIHLFGKAKRLFERLEIAAATIEQLNAVAETASPEITSQLGDDPVIHIQRRLQLRRRRQHEKEERRRRLVSRVFKR